MPHLHIDSFKTPKYPFTQDGIEFLFQADSSSDDNSLVAVRYKNKEFFLNLKNGAKKLIKADKTTRPTPNYILKKAMSTYASSLNLNILDSNIDNYNENIHLQTHHGLKTIDYFIDNFIDSENIAIEIGFGSGRHLLHQAKTNPHTFFIGLEIHKPSIEQVLKQLTIQSINNVFVLDYDARLFLELVPSNKIDKIYVHFPVPWDKKPHRRVISRDFLDEADRVLKPNASLELRTDSELYYKYALEVFETPQISQFCVTKNKDIAISSKYEDRWKKMSKNIYDVVFYSSNNSDALEKIEDFTFSKEITNEAIKNLVSTPITRDWGFIRVEKIFSIDNTSSLIKVAMGSFDRPENTYVLIEHNNTRYFPKLPIKSKTNHKAHKLLNEILNG